VNPSVENETVATNMFNVPEVETPSTGKNIQPKGSAPVKNLTKKDKKTVQIHTLTSKLQDTKIDQALSNSMSIWYIFKTISYRYRLNATLTKNILLILC